MRTLCLVVLLGLGAPALAQEAAAPQPNANADEIVVPGRRPANLRVEIEKLEGAVYERWNALNSNDELDIRCFKQAPTRSNIPLRRCAPNFVIQAESQLAKDSINSARGTGNSQNTDYLVAMEQKQRQLTEEMQRIAREDEQFMRDLTRLDELRTMQAKDKQSRAN